MKLWIARDKDNSLFLYRGNLINENDTCFVKLPSFEFSEITFENSPQKIELKLSNIK